MSEEENKNIPSEKSSDEATPPVEAPKADVSKTETPEITIPSTEEASNSDIVASKPESKERQSAVIGTVDIPRPAPTQQRRGPGGRGRGPGGGGRGPGGGGRGPGGGGRGPGGGGRGPGGRGGRSRFGGPKPQEEEGDGLFEKVVHINRCAKVVAGGRRFSFSALVVVGDQSGKVGVGYGKAKEVPECIRKGTEQAKRNMAPVSLRNNTIPHDVMGEHDGGRILLRPAVPGTGVIAGGGVRAVLEAAGIKDVLSKSLRSNNPGAMVFATLEALKQLRTAETIRALRKA